MSKRKSKQLYKIQVKEPAHEKFKYTKGVPEVDHFFAGCSSFRVYTDGKKYFSCLLIQSDLSKKINNYFIMQIQVSKYNGQV